MGGLMSRRKGMRNEYLVRDQFRAWGYDCHRVPSSGAAEGFKGDLIINRPQDKLSLLVEVKARKLAFRALYDLLETSPIPNSCYVDFPDKVVLLTFNDPLRSPPSSVVLTPTKRQMSVLCTSLKFLKGCDVLVLKDDRKSPIYIKEFQRQERSNGTSSLQD